ncbi:MAG: ferredoxin [Opitutae bacterium]|nr:ferredoxin [Opitutae bacterium]
MKEPSLQSGNQLSVRAILMWRAAQTLVWLAGLVILYYLIFDPTIGIHLFWNILIPVAPFLFVIAIGVWRNICPMASTALFSRHMGFSKRKRLSVKQSGKLRLIAVIALFLIVPLRHAIFNTNGLATAILILSLALVAIIMGVLFESKSGWCSSLCPVHPVEQLYGQSNRLSLQNAHCDNCYNCVIPCPDSTPGINPMSSKETTYHKAAGVLMVGSFPGFVWGWFQVRDYLVTDVHVAQLITIYKMPLIGLLASSALFLILKRFLKEKTLISIYSATAISCYYWYRIPALVGFGVFPEDGTLIDLTGSMPEWSITATIVATTLFFFWWIVARRENPLSWSARPPYACLKNETSGRQKGAKGESQPLPTELQA